MNTNRSKPYIFFLLLIIVFNTNAQNAFRKQLAIIPALSTTQFYGFTFGTELQAIKKINNNNSLFFAAGFNHFFGTVKANGYTVLPFKTGIRFNISENLYSSIAVGVGIGLNKLYNTGFVWSPSIGYTMQKIDVGIEYQDFIEHIYTKQIGFKVAYIL